MLEKDVGLLVQKAFGPQFGYGDGQTINGSELVPDSTALLADICTLMALVQSAEPVLNYILLILQNNFITNSFSRQPKVSV